MEWSGAGGPVPVRPVRARTKNVRFSMSGWATRGALAWIHRAGSGKGSFSYDENGVVRMRIWDHVLVCLVRRLFDEMSGVKTQFVY